MIKNFWKQIEVVCGNHGEDKTVKMSWKQGHRSMFYSCPKYYPDARVEGERACRNNVSVEDFEKIVDIQAVLRRLILHNIIFSKQSADLILSLYIF